MKYDIEIEKNKLITDMQSELNNNNNLMAYLTKIRILTPKIIKTLQIGVFLNDKIDINIQSLLNINKFENESLIFPVYVKNEFSHFRQKDPSKKNHIQIKKENRNKDYTFYHSPEATPDKWKDYIIIVEGEFDLAMVLEAEEPNVVATLGSLSEKQLDYLITLPAARGTIYTAFDKDTAGEKYLDKLASKLPKRDIKVLSWQDSKDIDEFLREVDDRKTALQGLIEQAQPYFEYKINNFDTIENKKIVNETKINLIKWVSKQDLIDQDEYKKIIKEQLNTPIATINKIIKSFEIKKSQEISPFHESPSEAIKEYLNDCKIRMERVDIDKIMELVINYLSINKARFFWSDNKLGLLVIPNSKTLEMKNSNIAYMSKVTDITGFTPISQLGKEIYNRLEIHCYKEGISINNLSWVYSDLKNKYIYISLQDSKIAIINENDIIIKENGMTGLDKENKKEKSILLSDSDKMDKIKILDIAKYNEDKAIDFIYEIISNFACSEKWKYFILCWVSSFLFLEFSGTRPHLRFEGNAGSGKTFASKIISYLIYGSEQQKRPTIASNYVDGMNNPIIIWENFETKQLRQFSDFINIACTGAIREKRAMSTNSRNITENVKCLINSNGIEPLSAFDALDRTYIINFNIEFQKSFLQESEIFNTIKINRNLFYTTIINQSQPILKAISNKNYYKQLEFLKNEYRMHDKQRTFEYLTIMIYYLDYYLIKFGYDKNKEIVVNEWLEGLKQSSDGHKQGTSPLLVLLGKLRNIVEPNLESEEGFTSSHPFALDKLTLKVQYEKKGNPYFNITASNLYNVLLTLSKDYGLKCPYENALSLSKNISLHKEYLKNIGWQVTKQERNNKGVYEWQWKGI